MNEIIASTVPPKAWPDLWHLQACFSDRPGILAELTDLLKEANIDIVSCRVETAEQNNCLNVDLQIDATLYQSRFDRHHKDRETGGGPTLAELKTRIAAHFIVDMLFPFATKPFLSIRRNLPLYRSQLKIGKREESELRGSIIKIPEEMMKEITDRFRRQYPNIENLKGPRSLPRACIVADTENCLLRILIIFPDTGHLHLRVHARNRVGTLATITKGFRDAQFNICQMYTRNLDNGEYSITDLLVHFPAPLERVKSDSELKDYVRGLFRRKPLKELECTVRWPKILKNQK